MKTGSLSPIENNEIQKIFSNDNFMERQVVRRTVTKAQSTVGNADVNGTTVVRKKNYQLPQCVFDGAFLTVCYSKRPSCRSDETSCKLTGRNVFCCHKPLCDIFQSPSVPSETSTTASVTSTVSLSTVSSSTVGSIPLTLALDYCASKGTNFILACSASNKLPKCPSGVGFVALCKVGTSPTDTVLCCYKEVDDLTTSTVTTTFPSLSTSSIKQSTPQVNDSAASSVGDTPTSTVHLETSTDESHSVELTSSAQGFTTTIDVEDCSLVNFTISSMTSSSTQETQTNKLSTTLELTTSSTAPKTSSSSSTNQTETNESLSTALQNSSTTSSPAGTQPLFTSPSTSSSTTSSPFTQTTTTADATMSSTLSMSPEPSTAKIPTCSGNEIIVHIPTHSFYCCLRLPCSGAFVPYFRFVESLEKVVCYC